MHRTSGPRHALPLPLHPSIRGVLARRFRSSIERRVPERLLEAVQRPEMIAVPWPALESAGAHGPLAKRSSLVTTWTSTSRLASCTVWGHPKKPSGRLRLADDTLEGGSNALVNPTCPQSVSRRWTASPNEPAHQRVCTAAACCADYSAVISVTLQKPGPSSKLTQSTPSGQSAAVSHIAGVARLVPPGSVGVAECSLTSQWPGPS